MEAEDLLQEGFVKIFRKIDTVKKENEQALFPWMRRVMVNLILNYLRDQKKYRFTEDVSGMEEKLADTISDEDIHPLFERIRPEQILEIISSLPDGYRTVFNLFAFENYGHHDIAEALGISVNTSKTQLMKARRMIAARLEKKITTEPVLKLVV
jgi:RNA polymerase sigma-70 factor (ECF subfamily)